MFNLVESYDELMDAFAKEVKEAPGWASLLILCTQLPKLLPPQVEWLRTSLGLHAEGRSIATPIAITLFLIGDILDAFVFPRIGKDQRKQKFFHSLTLIFAAWTLFLATVGEWWRAAFAFVLLVVPLTVDTLLKKDDESVKLTGWKWLIWPLNAWLQRAREMVSTRLKIDSGIYAHSKSLLRKSDNQWLRIGIATANESAKLLRSTFVPLLFWATSRMSANVRILLVAVAAMAFWAYALLKALHMGLLYMEAAIMVPAPAPMADSSATSV